MEPSSNRPIYVGRVNAVVDHIEAHLDEELTVEQLAAVAHFSPYHFHRIFSTTTGETLGGCIARLRLERAANRLVAQPHRPVTDIAFECGFASPSSFSRAFRGAYGMTPSAWRRGGHRGYERQSRAPDQDPSAEGLASSGEFGITSSRPAVDSGRTVWDVAAGALGSVSVRVEELAVTELAYVRYTGRYQGLDEVFAALLPGS